jgi:hypothetical protein
VQKEKAGGFGVFQKLLENREKENKQEKRREVLQNTFLFFLHKLDFDSNNYKSLQIFHFVVLINIRIGEGGFHSHTSKIEIDFVQNNF